MLPDATCAPFKYQSYESKPACAVNAAGKQFDDKVGGGIALFMEEIAAVIEYPEPLCAITTLILALTTNLKFDGLPSCALVNLII